MTSGWLFSWHFSWPVLAVLAATAGRAQDAYPTHVVKIVVPSLPGSTTDILARLVSNQLSEVWGKPVIVENMAGAAMAIGAEYVARAAPDGYTLLICPPSPVSIQHLLYHDLKYDPLKFTPIAMLAKIPNVLVVRPDLPANTIQELIAYGKANPGKLTYASQGAGSTAHLSGSELELLGGIKMVHVPYNGAQPALTDVHVRQCRHVLRHAHHLGAALSRRQAEIARRRQRGTLQGRAGDPDHRRIGTSRLPLDHLVSDRRAARPAAGFGRQDQRRRGGGAAEGRRSTTSCGRCGSSRWAARPPTPPSSSPRKPSCGAAS